MTDIGTFRWQPRTIDTRIDSWAAVQELRSPRVPLPRCGELSPLVRSRMLIWSCR
jgi:hypothetical protein